MLRRLWRLSVCALVLATALAPLEVRRADALSSGASNLIAQGFDRCDSVATSTMQTWWNSSPFWWFGFYLGGATANAPMVMCFQPSASWLSTVASQGWSFAPIWDGYQAPCATNYSQRFSADIPTAQTQGINDGNLAYDTAYAKGFRGRFIVYYDIEPFPNNAACRLAARSYLNGWVYALRARGAMTGIYGGCGSFPEDWALLANVPDVVWVAEYKTPPQPQTSVMSCVATYHWTEGQRLKQFEKEVVYPFGGITMKIDNDCSVGWVSPPSLYAFETAACV